jgi:hypothetical protein
VLPAFVNLKRTNIRYGAPEAVVAIYNICNPYGETLEQQEKIQWMR